MTVHSPLRLRDVQIAALDALVARHVAGVRRMLTVLPTGAGKTVVFANVPRALWERGGTGHRRGSRIGRVLVLAHRCELLAQAERTFRQWEPGAAVQIFQGGARPPLTDVHVLVASIQSISQPQTLASFPGDAFGLITIDEAHHATPESAYTRVVDHFGGRTATGAYVHGYTATPNRPDGETLGHLFDEIAFSRSISDGMRQGWLCDTRYRVVKVGADLLAVAGEGEFDNRQLASLMDREEITCTVIGAYLNVREEVRRWGVAPRTLGFAVNRTHARHIVAALRAVNIRAEYIGGDIAQSKRNECLAMFRDGRFEVLVSVDLLLEGFDDDGINIALDLKPTRSSILATQEFGRIVRRQVTYDAVTGTIRDRKPRAVYVQALPVHASETGMFTVPDVLGFKMDWNNADTIAALERMPLCDAADQLDAAIAIRGAIATMTTERECLGLLCSTSAIDDDPDTAVRAPAPEWTEDERRQWILNAFASAPEEIVQLIYALPSEFALSDFRWQAHLDKTIDLTLGQAGSLRILPRNLLGQYAVQQIDPRGNVTTVGTYAELQHGRDAAERIAVRRYPDAGRLYRKSLAERWMRRPASRAAQQRVRALYPTIQAGTLARLTAGVASELIRLASRYAPPTAGVTT